MRVAGVLGGPRRARPRLRHRLPPAAVRGDRGLGDRRGAAPRPGGAGPAADPARSPHVSVHQGIAQALPLPDASRRRRARSLGLLLRTGLRARPRRAGPRRTPRRGRAGDRQRPDPVDVRRLVPAGLPEAADPVPVERFWSTHGWTRTPVDMGWRFSSRADLEAVVRIEFDPRPPRRSSPSTRAPRSTTRSTSGRRPSDARQLGIPGRPGIPALVRRCNGREVRVSPVDRGFRQRQLSSNRGPPGSARAARRGSPRRARRAGPRAP